MSCVDEGNKIEKKRSQAYWYPNTYCEIYAVVILSVTDKNYINVKLISQGFLICI